MKTYNNQYTQKIYLLVSPLVGDIMAQSIIKTQAKRIGLDEDSITPSSLPQLAEVFSHGLALFLGKDSAEQLAKKIQQLH